MTETGFPQVKEVQDKELYNCFGSPFDIAPLLKHISATITPVELAELLDSAHDVLADYIIMDSTTSGLHYVTMLCHMRCLRNLLLQGAGYERFANNKKDL